MRVHTLSQIGDLDQCGMFVGMCFFERIPLLCADTKYGTDAAGIPALERDAQNGALLLLCVMTRPKGVCIHVDPGIVPHVCRVESGKQS